VPGAWCLVCHSVVSQAKKASRRRSKRRGRKAAELSNDDAALLVQTQVRRQSAATRNAEGSCSPCHAACRG
jgi:hypothetical protein